MEAPDRRSGRTEYGVPKVFVRLWPLWIILVILLVVLVGGVIPALTGVGPAAPQSTATSVQPGSNAPR